MVRTARAEFCAGKPLLLGHRGVHKDARVIRAEFRTSDRTLQGSSSLVSSGQRGRSDRNVALHAPVTPSIAADREVTYIMLSRVHEDPSIPLVLAGAAFTRGIFLGNGSGASGSSRNARRSATS